MVISFWPDMHVEEKKGEYSNVLWMQPTTQSNNGAELETGGGCVWPVKVKNSGVLVMKWVLLHLLKLPDVASVYFMDWTQVIQCKQGTKHAHQAESSPFVSILEAMLLRSAGTLASQYSHLCFHFLPPPAPCLEALRQVWLKTSSRWSLNPDYKTQHALFLPQPHHTPAYSLDDTQAYKYFWIECKALDRAALLDGLLSGVVGLAWSAAVSNREPADQLQGWPGGQWDDLSLNSGFGSSTNWILTPVSLKSKLRSVHALPCILNQFRRFELGNVTQQICFF